MDTKRLIRAFIEEREDALAAIEGLITNKASVADVVELAYHRVSRIEGITNTLYMGADGIIEERGILAIGNDVVDGILQRLTHYRDYEVPQEPTGIGWTSLDTLIEHIERVKNVVY